MKIKKDKLWLCLTPVVVGFLDHVFTLVGQGKDYWAGNFTVLEEQAPHARWLLQQHPLVFVAAYALYMLAYCLVIIVTPTRISKIVALALVIGHCWGVGTWLLFHFAGYWSCLLFFVLCAWLMEFSFERANRGSTGG